MDNQTNNCAQQQYLQNPPDSQSSALQQLRAAVPAEKFSRADVIAAWICFALGFVFARYVTRYSGGLFGGIFWACFGALGAVYARIRRLKTGAAQKAAFAVSEIFCLVPLFSANMFINTLAAWFTFLLMFYLLITLSGAELFGKHFAADMLKSAAVRPFVSFFKSAEAGFSPIKKKGSLRTVGFAAIGLVIAVPLTIVAVILLALSDSRFESAMYELFLALPGFSFSLIWQLVFGALVGMFLFGALYSSAKPVSGYNPAPPAFRILPPVTAYAAVTPMCVFYLVYVIIQFAGLNSILSDLSEYARRGFFELCVIAVINLCVIAVMQLFTARDENDRKPLSLKIYTTVISGFTLLFIVSAFIKMALYIRRFGLTPLRVYPSWFMGLLAFVFVVIIISQFADIHFWRVQFIGFTVLFGILCFSNVDGQIARYNVSFHSEANSTLDIQALSELNGMACEPLAELLLNGEEDSVNLSSEEIREFLANQISLLESQNDFAYFSFPRLAAKNSVSSVGITADIQKFSPYA